MNPHKVSMPPISPNLTMAANNGWLILEVFASIDRTKAFIGEIKDGLDSIDSKGKELATAIAANNKKAGEIEEQSSALVQERQDLTAEKERYAADVAALRPRLDAIAERERLADVEAANLAARSSALDSRESDLTKIRAELDERAANLKAEEAKLEARFASAKALLAAVPAAEG